MNDEVYAFALKSTLNEIQYACPDVTSNFIFKDCKLVATDETTEEETATKTMDAFNDIVERADIIGDVENITIQTAKGKVTIATINKLQLATVSSKEVDEKYVNTLTRTLIPTVIRLVDEIQPASTDNETTTLDQPEPEEDVADDKAEETENLGETADNTEDYEKYEDNKDYKNYQLEEAEETTATEPEEGEEVVQSEPEEAEPEIDDDPMLPEPPVTQLIVENLGGLLVPSDTVRVDQDVINQWIDLYGDKKINEVEVEALNGKTTRCKFKQIKKSKDSGKGIIKMPEKIQVTLETKQGELVTVKPVVEKTK